MEQRCSFSLVCFFLFLIPPATVTPAEATPFIDLINSTCTQCAQSSAVFNYDFCVTSLQPIPITHAANLEGIAVVAVELALQNATATVSTIQEMLAGAAAFDPFAVGCLRDCLELYADAIVMLVDSFWEFFTRRFSTANILLSAVMETASTCEEGFKEKEVEMAAAPPLTEENENLFRLSEIALCITKLVSGGEEVMRKFS
ncbi:PREDICTED: putative invertase inhibitor [Ipomoea nil]|uniref:putative invertase inhibitor n=1 Tax=Ipomoea nil TaxID=35883 RepID=UPI00090124AB|nr:PREDICTED: putative invertase inhibitor [Ipomoea nil]